MADDEFEVPADPPPSVGAQLRAAREARGLTLAQVGAESRIPQRHLLTMEEGGFASLPGRTYAVGFARTYARLVGLDQDQVASLVRAELGAVDPDPRHRAASFEPGDPARVPSSKLGWLSALAVVLVLAGLFAFFRPYFMPAGNLPSLIEQQDAERRAAAAAKVPAAGQSATAAPAAIGGQVVFTALEEGIWVKFYDASGKQLMQKQMAKGERYPVPADAPGPQIWTGRPEALAITVGGRPVAKLADEQRTMKDVPVTAAALLARGQPAATTSPAPPVAATSSPTT
jgi:cytoskeletal protein RodZ